MREPVAVLRPGGAALPLVYDSPHSGTEWPGDVATAVPPEALRVYEDRLVDGLVTDAPGLGVALVAARFARAYIDPNRAADDLEDAIVGPDWEDERAPSPLAEQGIGLVFRKLPDGRAIYGGPLGRAEIGARIETCWRPYHAALEAALADAQARHGRVWHVNWHSMRAEGDALAPDPGRRRPDFVVSDRDGTTASAAFTGAVAAILGAGGRSVALNEPFRGGHIVALHGRPEEGRESVQVEINRALYLDPETLEPGPGFGALRAALRAATAALGAWVRDAARGAG